MTHLMKRWDKPCARPDGHEGAHVSVEAALHQGSMQATYSRRHYDKVRRGDSILYLLRNTKHRAKRDGIPFALTRENLPETPDACPCCGTTLDRDGDWYHQPSLDRKVPGRGYVPENVQWLCRRCNQVKSNATPEELMRVALFSQREVA